MIVVVNNRWRSIRKSNWGQLVDPLDGSYVGWHTRHHKNDKRDRHRLKKRGINTGIDFSKKSGRTIQAVHRGHIVGEWGDHD